jgi:hypothetical protein
MMALALLGIAAAFGLGTLILTLSLVRALIRWAVGASGSTRAAGHEPVSSTVLVPHPVSGSDLFAVRSNLDAVSRQLEDLERKLRRATPTAAIAKHPRGK